MYLKLFFIIIGSLLAALLILEITYVYNLKDNMKKSSFVSFLTGLFLLYVISALSLMIIIPGVFNKLLILGFGLSPFIIGRFVTYNNIKIYSIIQILCIIMSVGYVTLI